MKNKIQEIEKIEDAVRSAQLAGDAAFFEEILAEDFKFITPQGKIVTKREDIDQYRSGRLRLSSVDISEREIDLFAGAAVSRFKVKFAGRAGKYSFATDFLFTRVYANISNEWKMVAGHSTEIPSS